MASLRNDVGGLCQSPCFEYVVRNEVMLHIAFIITRQKNSDSTLPHKIIRNLCVFHSTKYNLTKVRLAGYLCLTMTESRKSLIIFSAVVIQSHGVHNNTN